MTIATHIKTKMSGSSWIRKMFEEGARLKAEHGADKVFDFSLGNPNLEPPEIFREGTQKYGNVIGGNRSWIYAQYRVSLCPKVRG